MDTKDLHRTLGLILRLESFVGRKETSALQNILSVLFGYQATIEEVEIVREEFRKKKNETK